MGIGIEDDFRYVIIDESTGKNQAHSQTKNVTIYHIHPFEDIPAIIIVDTPGFGDTEGFEMDKVVTELIKYAFTHILTNITAVCFVAQSSNARLTANQKYIFNKVMELFGKDIAENFIATLTFCDGDDPQILNALKEKHSVFDTIIDKIKPPWYLKFNNSAFFNQYREDDDFSKMYWKLGFESFRKFITKLKFLPKKSLCQSKDVLKEREVLENTILTIRPLLDQGLSCMETIRKLHSAIKDNKYTINTSKNFKIKITKPDFKTRELPQGIHTTTCLTCNFTCHPNCAYSDDAEKSNCCAMSNGYCTVCSGKCYWNSHKNVPYVIEITTIEEEVTQKELESKYYQARNEKSKSEQILQGLQQDFDKLQLQCYNNQE